MNTLPLLEYTADMIGKKAFEDVTVIGCQHFLHTNYLMFEKMFELGLRPQQTHIIGKSYSINSLIEKLFIEKRVNVYKYEYDSHKSFDQQFDSETDRFLKKIKSNIVDNNKILVIDDGAILLKKVGEYFEDKNICGVEQTSSGYNILKDQNTNFPIINVARSEAKLRHESPFIGELAIKKLEAYIKKYNPKNALIIGAGPIGLNIYRQLTIKNKEIYDIARGQEDLGSLLTRNQLIIGCTGTTSVPKELHKNICRGTVLVSVSSSDREFDSVYLRKKTEKNNDAHLDMNIDGVHLVNSGFPITFDGGLHGSPPEKIQLTQSLMLAGCYAAINEQRHGLQELDIHVQDSIVTKYSSLGGKK